MNNQSVIDKVKKLINHAKDPGCSTEESMTSMTKATELMNKYKIDELSVFNSLNSTNTEVITSISSEIVNAFIKDNQILAYTIARHNRCIVTLERSNGHRIAKINFNGRDTDAWLAQNMYEAACTVIERNGKSLEKTHIKMYQSARGVFVSYRHGFVHGFISMLNKLSQSIPGYSLVITTDPEVQKFVDDHTSKRMFQSKSRGPDIQIGDSAYQEGMKDGKGFGSQIEVVKQPSRHESARITLQV